MNVLSDRFDDADISATASPAGSVVMNFVLDDGDIDLFTIIDTEASGITLTVNQVQDYFNTADLTERDFARQVAESCSITSSLGLLWKTKAILMYWQQ